MRRHVVAVAILLAGCEGALPPAETPAPPPAPPPPVATAPVVTPPALRLVAVDAVAEEPSPPLPEPLGAITRSFERVALPASVGAIEAVGGRDARHVWMVSASFDLLSWDGARLSRAKAPSCPFHYEINLGGGTQRYVYEPRYTRLTVTSDEIVLGGLRPQIGPRGSYALDVEARSRTGKGKWICHETGGVFPPIERIAGTARLHMRVSTSKGLTIDGRPAPLPADEMNEGVDLGGRAADDLWLWSTELDRVWQGNGVAWQLRPTRLAQLIDVWLDEAGHPWVLGVDARQRGVVLRWDDDAGTWKRLPIQDVAGAELIRGAGRELWLIGGTYVYHWDGRVLRRASAPVAKVKGAWISASGELWIVGADPSRQVKTDEDPVPAGVAYRVPAEQGKP